MCACSLLATNDATCTCHAQHRIGTDLATGQMFQSYTWPDGWTLVEMRASADRWETWQPVASGFAGVAA